MNWFWNRKIVFFVKGFNLILGSVSKSNFWQYFNCVVKGNLIGFEIEKNKGLNLWLGSASKSNVWQYFNCVVKGNLIDFDFVF